MDRSLVLLAVLISCSLAQPCNFAVKSPTISGYLNTKPVWYGRPLELTTCYLNTPFNKTVLDQTVAVLKAAMEMYTFRDVVSQSGPPYNIQVRILFRNKPNLLVVDWSTCWNLKNFYRNLRLGNARWYVFPWIISGDFFLAISKAFDKAKDNHLRYTLPGGTFSNKIQTEFHRTSANFIKRLWIPLRCFAVPLDFRLCERKTSFQSGRRAVRKCM